MIRLQRFIFFPLAAVIFRCIPAFSQSCIGTPPACYCNAVGIVTQPVNPPINCPAGGPSTITVTVNGTGPFTYRWQENFLNITDGGVYSGTSTATLTITNPSINMNGKTYRCIITNCSGSRYAVTNNAMLSVTTNPADINMDGITDVSDFNQFIQSFNSGCSGCREDINKDSFVNTDDFLLLVSQFNQSCK
jgi:hypothetical protein